MVVAAAEAAEAGDAVGVEEALAVGGVAEALVAVVVVLQVAAGVGVVDAVDLVVAVVAAEVVEAAVANEGLSAPHLPLLEGLGVAEASTGSPYHKPRQRSAISSIYVLCGRVMQTNAFSLARTLL
jgi:hypothetical protein